MYHMALIRRRAVPAAEWPYLEKEGFVKELLVLAGDGIGPEVCAQALRVVEVLIAKHQLEVRIENRAIGGASYDLCGTPLSDEVRTLAGEVDAVLVGAVGGPKWQDVSREKRPEAGLLELRKAMRTYINLRPAYCFDPLVDASSLKPDVIKGLNLIFVRELMGGVYFGEPRGVLQISAGVEKGFDTQVYTTPEIERIARAAFDLARQRQNRLVSVDKANVMESGVLWRAVVDRLHEGEYADVALTHMYADNCAMQLVRNPRQFDVILTDNLFGDILSDAAAMVTGSLGMLPSASLSDIGRPGLYEPIHGSAPDIAGQNLANPIATILSIGMALRWSLERPDLGKLVDDAVGTALARGARTRDLGGEMSTEDMGSAIVQAIGVAA